MPSDVATDEMYTRSELSFLDLRTTRFSLFRIIGLKNSPIFWCRMGYFAKVAKSFNTVFSKSSSSAMNPDSIKLFGCNLA